MKDSLSRNLGQNKRIYIGEIKEYTGLYDHLSLSFSARFIWLIIYPNDQAFSL